MSAAGHQSVDVDVQLYGWKSQEMRELRHTRAKLTQPHAAPFFLQTDVRLDETGAGLLGEALWAFIPAASSLRTRRYDVRAEITGRAR
jgi:hypothetical protein